jgi:hypothetical protein
MLSMLFETWLEAVRRESWTEAEVLASDAVESAPRFQDPFFLLAAVHFLRGNPARALRTLEPGLRTGLKASQDFFDRLGKLIEVLGVERGDALHRFFQAHRVLPWQLVGSLTGAQTWTEAEPWNYSRESTRFFPRQAAELDDLARLIERHVLEGFLPAAPPFERRTSQVLTIGSCFAQNLRNTLAEKGLLADWLFVPPGLNNTFALRDFVDWCLTGSRSTSAYWYDEHAKGGAARWEPQHEHRKYREVFEAVDGIVLTVGLAEVWFDEPSGGVFWRGVPKSLYDPARHKCRVSSVAENRANLGHIVHAVRGLRPELPIIVTLSPVPLKATFGAGSIMAADCVSKSTLRVAIHELMQEHLPGVHYWPSFEIVRWLGSHLQERLFGEDGNPRHVNRRIVRLAVEGFIRHFYA